MISNPIKSIKPHRLIRFTDITLIFGPHFGPFVIVSCQKIVSQSQCWSGRNCKSAYPGRWTSERGVTRTFCMGQSAATAVYFGRKTPDSGFPGQPPLNETVTSLRNIFRSGRPISSASGNETMQIGGFQLT